VRDGAAGARALLAIARDLGDDKRDDEEWSMAELERIAALVRRSADDAGDPLASMNDAVFRTLGFVREVEDTDLRYVLLPSVLRARRGSCVGLGSLYLALGDILRVSLEGVMRPGHFYVRLRSGSGGHLNAELLRQGEAMRDAWYDERFPVRSASGPEYARGLTLGEVLGVVAYDVGNERRREAKLAAARRAYERAVQEFPGFAEAQASLGATLHLLGELDDAARAYHAARRANPRLPGLEDNLRLLEHERAGSEHPW
jgi:tetratricopeptide (TPR) repeat protein